METPEPITEKKLDIAFFYAAYTKIREAELKQAIEDRQARLDVMYEYYAQKFTSENFLTGAVASAIKEGKTEASVFGEYEDEVKNIRYADFHVLFNEEYGKEKKPSLKSLLMGNLSDQFMTVTMTKKKQRLSGYYNHYEVSIFWTENSIMGDEQRRLTKRKRADDEEEEADAVKLAKSSWKNKQFTILFYVSCLTNTVVSSHKTFSL